MALALGNGFVPYLAPVLEILRQAATLEVSKENFDAIDFGNDFRDGCLEAYTGIIQGLKPPSAAQEGPCKNDCRVCRSLYCLSLYSVPK